MAGKFEKALDEIDELIRLNPEDGFYYFVKGTVIYHSGSSIRDALSMFEYSLRLKPNLVENHLFMGYCKMCEGKFYDAVAELNSFIEQKGNEPNSYLMAALCFMAAGDKTKAQELLEKAVALAPALTAQTAQQQFSDLVFNQIELHEKIKIALKAAASEIIGLFGVAVKGVN
ncbi:hypothetical protein COT30_00980 [Candidatus Micrarchaeota archaeon CG08_land_8_20_14_0_20_49_17]|nr:MAG: hypothetical protein COT30_00980 [Candidatus Micrarchaeota archaeon CG08_land_8_20_14_0_20_49_17]PIZ92210.1 MAG: hypothetical protein COX84_07155 [Candidatus Micrarchaeota archaeon CG_4_10_14_0_2_um_filter_49_7]HII53783.1 hypothetical protein [Candidatus Micrarchaeota archaeon]